MFERKWVVSKGGILGNMEVMDGLAVFALYQRALYKTLICLLYDSVIV